MDAPCPAREQAEHLDYFLNALLFHYSCQSNVDYQNSMFVWSHRMGIFRLVLSFQ